MVQRFLVCLFVLSSGLLSAQDNVLGIQLPADIGYPFNITLFRPADSTQLKTTDVLKKGEGPTVVAFWLTTCMPCHRELTAYTQAYESWKKQAKFKLVAISTDFPQRFQEIDSIAQQIGMPFEVYWDGHREFRNVLPGELNGLPQVFIFDKNGKLAWHHKRYRPGDEQAVLAQILALQ
jgi:cytochrome c biogenesis protein CcmG/thiol:disulfide interchange protein DsbE